MRRPIALHTRVHLTFLARNRLFHGFSLLVAVGVALRIVPMLVFFDRPSLFVTLRGLAQQLHGLAAFMTAGIGLFILWSHRRARSIKMVATSPVPFAAWVASIFATAATVGALVQAGIACLIFVLSFPWNVPYQAGFFYIAVDRFAESMILLAFVTALGSWFHPIVAVLLITLLNESVFLRMRIILDAAEPRLLLTILESVVVSLYYLVPTFDPFGGRTLTMTRSLRVSETDWEYLGATAGYALLAAGFGFATTVAILRRRPMT
jgi:hypothetical protein